MDKVQLSCQSQEFLIQPGRLPVPTAMRLQTRLGQNVGDRRVMDGIDDGLLDHDLLQGATIPPRHVYPVGLRSGARHALDGDPLQRGKKRGGDHCAERQRSPRFPAADSAATDTTSSFAPPYSNARCPRSVLPAPRPTALV